MKFIISILFVALFSFSSFAQMDDKNSVSVDLFRGLTRDNDIYRWLIQYERAFHPNFSAVVAYEFGQYEYHSNSTISSGNVTKLEEYTVNGNMLLLEGRYYPFIRNKTAPRGFFVGSYFKNFWLEEENSGTDSQKNFKKKHSLQALGIDVGYQLFGGLFMMEPVIGFGKAWHTDIGEDDRIDSHTSSFEPSNYAFRLALNVGLCF